MGSGFDFAEYRRKRRAAGKDKSVRLGDKVTTEQSARRRLRGETHHDKEKETDDAGQ